MSVREFKLPDVGEGVAEGELVRWLVAPGDPVSEDQPVAEVETDKALVELPSPYDGTVRELRAEEGEIVPVGTVVITFDVPDEDEDGAPAGAEAADVEPEPVETGAEAEPEPEPVTGESRGGRVFAPPSARRLARELGVELGRVAGSGPGGRVTEADVRAAAGAGTGAGADDGEDGTGDRPRPRTPGGGRSVVRARGDDGAGAAGTGASEAGGDGGSAAPAGRERTLATPAARRVAGEEGVDIDDVPAVEEREGEAYVTEAAVREYAAAQRAAQAADAAAVAGAGTGTDEGASAAGERPEPRSVDAGAAAVAEADGEAAAAEAGDGAAAGVVDGESAPSGERVPYRGVRRTIGEAMERSKDTAPHVTHTDVADVTALVELREELKPVAAEDDVRLTYTPFVMKACVAALKRHPYLNAMLDEEADEIVLRDEYHLGVATATDVGLMVPVVRDVDAKGLATVARETNDVVERARERTVTREELRGSTFTVTNFGVIGGEFATPILNHPEVAILGLGAIEERPRVVEGEVVARTTLPLSLTIDHRVVDGAVAARFTNTLVEFLEQPRRLLLE